MLAGSEKPDPWISLLSVLGFLPVPVMAITSTAEGRTEICKPLFTVTVRWPQETQMSEDP